jgi:Protein of unknown function (DUF3341)
MATTSNSPLDLEVIKERIGLGPDKVHAVMGSFDGPDEIVAAGRKIREMGYSKLDAMTPFPVHGIDDAIGVPPSTLGWFVICVGLTGTATAQLLQWWCGAINYPLIIGGKPLYDFSFSIPITFELTVLFSAFAAVFGMLIGWNDLPKLYHPTMNYSLAHRATDDQFILVIEAADPKFDASRASEDLKSVGAHTVEVVEG